MILYYQSLKVKQSLLSKLHFPPASTFSSGAAADDFDQNSLDLDAAGVKFSR
jgi:hypothetical protein